MKEAEHDFSGGIIASVNHTGDSASPAGGAAFVRPKEKDQPVRAGQKGRVRPDEPGGITG